MRWFGWRLAVRTDHEQYTGELAGGFAFVPGHETVGTIDAIGPQAAQRWGVAAGDRVRRRHIECGQASQGSCGAVTSIERCLGESATDLDE